MKKGNSTGPDIMLIAHRPDSVSRSTSCPAMFWADTVGSIHSLEGGVEWRIPGFPSLPSNWRFWTSPPFQFRGQGWLFRRWDLLACIAVYLLREATPSECRVTCEVGFRKADGATDILNEGSFTFGAGKERWECFTFSESDLERRSDELVPSDQLTVVCHMRSGDPQPVAPASAAAMAGLQDPWVLKEPSSFVEASTQTHSEFSEPEVVKASAELAEASTQTQSDCSKLYRDLTELLLNGEDSDLTVKLKGAEFRLHRLVMEARTPVIGATLRRDVEEKATDIVPVDDCDAKVFRAFVRYVYNDSRTDQLTTDTVFGLFELADKYQVDSLKSACLDFIQRSLSVDTFCDVAKLAFTYDQRELLQQATDFLAENMEVVLQTVRWTNFMTEHCAQANELMLKAVRINNAKEK